MLGHQGMQPRDALQPLRQPGPRQQTTVRIRKLDVMVVLSPIVSDEQHLGLSSFVQTDQTAAPGDTCNLMIKCSRRGGHDIPSAVQSPANRRVHDLSVGLPDGTWFHEC